MLKLIWILAVGADFRFSGVFFGQIHKEEKKVVFVSWPAKATYSTWQKTWHVGFQKEKKMEQLPSGFSI